MRRDLKIAAAVSPLLLLAAVLMRDGASLAASKVSPQEAQVKSGTGFFVSPGGFLLTSRHVVAGCRGVSVWPLDGARHSAKLVAADEQLDIALLSVDGGGDGYDVSRYRDGLELGDKVLTIGYGVYPTQPRKSVLTQGTFVRRAVSPGGARIMIVVATLHPGNSGGPVIDPSGALVGMVIGRFAEHANLGVIVPGRAIDRFLTLTGLSHLSAEPKGTRTDNPDEVISRISALVQCAGGGP